MDIITAHKIASRSLAALIDTGVITNKTLVPQIHMFTVLAVLEESNDMPMPEFDLSRFATKISDIIIQ